MRSPRLLILGTILLGLILSLPSNSGGEEYQIDNSQLVIDPSRTFNYFQIQSPDECSQKTWEVPSFLRYADVYCCDAKDKLSCLENKQTMVDKFITLLTPMEQKTTYYCSKNYVPEPPPCEVPALPDESQEDTLTRSLEGCVAQIKGTLDRINQQLDHCDPEAPPVIY